ncbi:abortive infection family protein [Vibrio apostichopi]|uniref:abortive infection family protein n=1 Tax=Vibrio apostichopi TaxID=3035453 RepID=UPI00257261B0|nr:abortive infection family protein [Vibrio sp. FE10]
MSDLNGKQLIKLAVVLQDLFSTGDWQELFTVTDTEDFIVLHSSFMRDVNWQNATLKQGCISAVKYVLESDESNLNEIWKLGQVQTSLKREEPELYLVIEAIVDGIEVVATPDVANINDTVFKALEDAEVLLSTQGAASAYDRTHTALHGFLRQVCKNKGIAYSDNDAITALLPKVNDYIKRQPDIGRNEQVFNMLRSAGSMLNTINYLRNHHSLSHANQDLLTEADAQFSINLTRSIMSYIDGLVG